ncbi:MAG: inositol monophosphatase family protein [Steroidobacteraceae bacterium]|nr:inositol monophosphatase family protein [Steroidobacteraceae bacterium]
MHPLLNIGIRAARRAGTVVVRALNRLDSIDVASKGRNDFVSEVDRQAEQEIIATVRRAYPAHGFLCEESGVTDARPGGDEYVWIVDPLDGTTNFLHGFPQFCVSIAVQVRGRVELAIVYDPLKQELFTATRGGGAQLDERRIRVSKSRGLEGALIGTGFPYSSNQQWLDAYMAMLKAVTLASAGVRRPGSAALDLAYVAAGRTDGFWELGLKPWDTAAGALLITEAGGRVGTLTGEEYLLGPHVVAGSPKTYEALVELLRPHVPEELRAKRG